ncbi:MAG: nucleotide exchange factor GrpE [Pseudomonadota bacterium]|nr:nucleotide exchange factor GrpE [Pseudomonadota bacterium]
MNETEPKTAEAPTASAAPQDTGAPFDGGQVSEAAGGEEAIEPLGGASAEIEKLEAEKADLTDRLLRLAADMDNLRRRTERDVVDARKYAVTKFAGDMLVVADNLQRALEAVPAESRESGDEPFKALLAGVELTGRELDRLLQRNGIAKIAAKGERFDPNRHQAVFEVPDPSVPAGTVAQVMQEGFTIGDRVLRAAMVGVAKGGPSAGAAAAAEPAAEVSGSPG